jgi:hypothetical protein
MGCLKSLIHFMSWLGERGLPKKKLLKKSDSFHRTDETQKALDELKALITKLLVLASPEPSKTLLIHGGNHLAHQHDPGSGTGGTQARLQGAVAGLLHQQSPIRSRDSIQSGQKLLYVILITKCKLLHNFNSHPVHVVTSYGLGEIVGNRLATGRIAKWPPKLIGLDIT